MSVSGDGGEGANEHTRKVMPNSQLVKVDNLKSYIHVHRFCTHYLSLQYMTRTSHEAGRQAGKYMSTDVCVSVLRTNSQQFPIVH